VAIINFYVINLVRVLVFLAFLLGGIWLFFVDLNKSVLTHLAPKYVESFKKITFPQIQKYLKRKDFLEKLQDQELTDYANQIAKDCGVIDKDIFVLVTTENDPIFSYLKGLCVFDCVSQVIILVQRDFIENYSKGSVKAAICHEVGHIVSGDNLVRYCLSYDNFYYWFVVLGLFVFMLTFVSSWIWAVCAGVASLSIAYYAWMILFAYFAQGHEFKADSFSVIYCGKETSLQMLDDLAEIVGGKLGHNNSWWGGFFATHPSYQRRVAAVKSVVLNKSEKI